MGYLVNEGQQIVHELDQDAEVIGDEVQTVAMTHEVREQVMLIANRESRATILASIKSDRSALDWRTISKPRSEKTTISIFVNQQQDASKPAFDAKTGEVKLDIDIPIIDGTVDYGAAVAEIDRQLRVQAETD